MLRCEFQELQTWECNVLNSVYILLLCLSLDEKCFHEIAHISYIYIIFLQSSSLSPKLEILFLVSYFWKYSPHTKCFKHRL